MNTILRTKPKREELPAGRVLCEYCVAKCCRYFALPIEKPVTLQDFQYIRWYLMHAHSSVFVEDGVWHLLVQTTCKHLLDDHRCGIYQTRPAICREYSTDNCEYEDYFVYERYFETSEQVQDYCDAMFAEPGDEHFRSPRPALLPIIH
jgi:Fe-S-cluster containining protein